MLKLQLETSFYGCNPQTFQDYDLISISLKTILHTYLLISYLLVLTSLANKAVTRVLNPCLCLASVWSMSKLHLFLVVFFFWLTSSVFPRMSWRELPESLLSTLFYQVNSNVF